MFCCRKFCSSSAHYTVQESFVQTVPTITQPTTQFTVTDLNSTIVEEVPQNNGSEISEQSGQNCKLSKDLSDRNVDMINNSDCDADNVEADDSETEGDEDVTIRNEMIQKRVGVISKTVTDVKKEIVKYPKNQNETNLIKNAIASSEFLNNVINDTEIDEIIDSMYLRELERNDIIIKEGDDGTFICISAGGSYDVEVNGQIVNQFSNYRVFGEHAILYNAKRNATIRCTSTCRVWVLDREIFQHVMIRSAMKEQEEYFRFLKNVPILKKANDDKLKHVANLLKKEFFTMNTKIVTEGDIGDKFYLIRAGSVTISKISGGIITTFTKGQFFGERALITEEKRAATVVADPPGVECLSLDRKDFLEHLGDISDLTKPEPDKKIPEKSVTNKYSDIEINELRIVGTLGVGGFGRVELVKHKKKPDLVFALKYLKKTDMVREQQQEHAYNEKKIQMDCDSIFIVHLYKTFRDKKYLYFLMEACLGGDLFGLLQKQKNRFFDEKHARFYAACVLESLSYLHDRNYIYRDLKPENLMIDAKGYLKLTDFGFAKKVDPHQRTFTFAGTPEYVAPEIILQRGHNKGVDYWAYGIFIYELLAGRTPFKSNDSSHFVIYNQIILGIDNARFPTNMVKTAQNLVKKLCKATPMDRLGCQKNGADAIRNHRWFLGFNWDHLRAKTMKAPHVPRLKNIIDLRYFEQFKKDNDVPADDETGWDFDF